MKETVKVGVSNHHVHLTKEVFIELFNKENLTIKKPLHQLGEFAANEMVDIRYKTNIIRNLRIVGPFRSYNQVEISASDARKLKINPPVRQSGDLAGSFPVTIIGPEKEITLEEGIIIANRHVHFNTKDAQKYNIVDNEKLYIKVKGEKSGILDAMAKVSDNGYFELHIDTDDANAFLLNDGDEVEVSNKLR